MAEPHSTVVAGALIGAGVSIPSVLLGAQVDALVAGLVAAFLVSIWMEPIDTRAKAASAVLLSSLLAGYGSPVAAQWLTANMDGVAYTDGLRLLTAVLIGVAMPFAIPLAVRFFSKKYEGGAA